MNGDRCPKCGSTTTIEGIATQVNGTGTGWRVSRFEPKGMRWWAWAKHWRTPELGAVHACLSCGHVWSSLNPAKLRRFIADHGRDDAKRLLGSLKPIDGKIDPDF